MSCKESNSWYNAMKDELDSMRSSIVVWDLVLPKGVNINSCKWVFKTKSDGFA